jgi:hypothetical protein
VRVVQDEVSTEQDRDTIAEQKDPKGGDKDEQIAGEPAPESGGCGSGRRVGEYLSSRVKTKAKKRRHRRAGCRSPAFRRQGSERTWQRTKALRKSESGRTERPPACCESGTGARVVPAVPKSESQVPVAFLLSQVWVSGSLSGGVDQRHHCR